MELRIEDRVSKRQRTYFGLSHNLTWYHVFEEPEQYKNHVIARVACTGGVEELFELVFLIFDVVHGFEQGFNCLFLSSFSVSVVCYFV